MLKEKYKKVEEYYKTKNPYQKKAVRLKVPGYLQENSYYCGPASVQNLVKYSTGKKIAQSTLAKSMGTTSSIGTYVYKVTEELRKRTGITYAHFNNSQYNFYKCIQISTDGNRLVIYNVNTKALDSSYNFSSGHYIVGNGYATNGTNINSVYYYDVYYDSKVTGDRACTKAHMDKALKAGSNFFIW